MTNSNNINLPAKLKSDCAAQFDTALLALGIKQYIGISLISYEVEQHLATSAVLDMLKQIEGIVTRADPVDDIPLQSSDSVQYLGISDNGDVLHLAPTDDAELITVSIFSKPGELHHSEEVAYADLDDELGIVAIITISIAKPTSLPVVNTSANKSSNNPSEGAPANHYAIAHFTRHPRIIFSIIGIAIALALLGVITPLGFQTFTDKILPYQAQNSLMAIAILLVVAALVTALFSYFHDYQESVLFAKYQSGLGKEVFQRLLAMEIPYFDSRNVGDLTKLVDQVEEASNFLVKQLLGSIVALVSLLVVLPILFMYDTTLTMIVLGIGVLMAITIGLSLRPLRQRVMQAYTYDAGFQSTLIETLKGMKTIKSLANESFFRQRANHSLEVNLYGGFHVAKLGNAVRAIVSFQSQLITICVIFFGAQAVFANTMTIGQLIAFNMLANNVVNPLVALVFTASGYETFRLAKRKLSELEPPVEQALPLAEDNVSLAGTIEFKDVWFRYPDTEDYVLEGINLTIEQGAIVGIVGGSGSGKSTLAALIMGFYTPERGSVKINGYDLSLLPKSLLRSRIAAVQQTSFLFNTSVLQNIHLGRLNASVDDIQQSLNASGSSEFVDAMPHRFMTELSEDADNLSGGQRQRLAIARALVRNADILLFDEATSALDNQTEDTIKQTIHAACVNKTGIIIAHRLNTLSYCHQLIVMQEGKVEAQGSHEELIAGDNSYRTMWQSTQQRNTAVAEPKATTKVSSDGTANIPAPDQNQNQNQNQSEN